MSFQPYKLKYRDSRRIAGITGAHYNYENTSIVVSVEKDTRCVSMAAHGIGMELPDSVKSEILKHFGFNMTQPIKESIISHPFDPTFGDTHYYIQDVSET